MMDCRRGFAFSGRDRVRQCEPSWEIGREEIGQIGRDRLLRQPTIRSSSLRPRPKIQSTPCLQPALDLGMRHGRHAACNCRPAAIQFSKAGIIGCKRHKFGNQVGHGDASRRRASLQFCRRRGVHFNGFGSTTHVKSIIAARPCFKAPPKTTPPACAGR